MRREREGTGGVGVEAGERASAASSLTLTRGRSRRGSRQTEVVPQTYMPEGGGRCDDGVRGCRSTVQERRERERRGEGGGERAAVRVQSAGSAEQVKVRVAVCYVSTVSQL
jgi:hypothetical protein